MMRSLFVCHPPKPLFVCSLTHPELDRNFAAMRNGFYDGADGFLLHLEKLQESDRTPERLKWIFDGMEDRPCLTTNYRGNNISDDDLMAFQKVAIEAGAACVDIMGDMFCPSPCELALDPAAVEKQREYIAWVHDHGAQVMMSSHIDHFLTTDELVKQALEMESRDVDFVKVVVKTSTENELMEGMNSTVALRRALKKPFLHIIGGDRGRFHRILAPTLGSCMVLVTEDYQPGSPMHKPLIRSARAVYENLPYTPVWDEE